MRGDQLVGTMDIDGGSGSMEQKKKTTKKKNKNQKQTKNPPNNFTSPFSERDDVGVRSGILKNLGPHPLMSGAS